MFGALAIATYFEILPAGDLIYSFIDDAVANCAGTELEASNSHVCGFLDPRNVIIAVPGGIAAAIFGISLIRKSLRSGTAATNKAV
jgi:hypothetical protein